MSAIKLCVCVCQIFVSMQAEALAASLAAGDQLRKEDLMILLSEDYRTYLDRPEWHEQEEQREGRRVAIGKSCL